MKNIVFTVLIFGLGLCGVSADDKAIPDFSVMVQKGGRTQEIVKIYGHRIPVKKIELYGTSIKWDDVKQLLPPLLPDSQEKSLTAKELEKRVHDRMRAAMRAYGKFVKKLASGLSRVLPDKHIQMLEAEIADYCVVNKSRLLVPEYKSADPRIGAKLRKVQRVHNQFLALMMLHKMIKKEKK
jgi:hypothetical protein